MSQLTTQSSLHDVLVTDVDSLCVMLIRRTILLSLDFPDIRNGEDMAIIPVIIARASAFGFVDRALYNYRYSAVSLSNSKNSTKIESMRNSFSYIEKELRAQYQVECEYIGIRNVLYGVLLNLLKMGLNRKRAIKIKNQFEAVYPNWHTNRYYRRLPFYKRVFLFAIKRNMVVVAWIMAMLHTFVLNIGI